eukprot:CAMPEP_0119339794 /NCGR_PEP_ID=MMETSP1333-20130426/99058_1 /TAXON_ID=418940 /ORGANISM="Scyphosphaera apsteinii, Strain RCC1455" /LENGTH=64 /DNA_ID=CAMNT_0007351395 /DNA_START=173 /DNA_END=367 /DNA_ORIENTATION=-
MHTPLAPVMAKSNSLCGTSSVMLRQAATMSAVKAAMEQRESRASPCASSRKIGPSQSPALESAA